MNSSVVMRELERTFDRKIKPHFVREFEKITANWGHRVGFAARKFLHADGLRITVHPTGSDEAKQIWWWNVKGTRPHIIEARNSPVLAFPWNGPGSYQAKTKPGGFYGGPGRVVGGRMVFTKAVNHPGTEPREWPRIIAEQNEGYFRREVENAWRRGTRKM